MDYDDLFPTEEIAMMEHIGGSGGGDGGDVGDIELEDDYTIVKKKVKKVKTNNIEYNNKIGWVLRRPTPLQPQSKTGGGGGGGGAPREKNNLEYIEFHKTSYVPGSNIKNAITGEFYPYLVGSNDEKLLFKIAICTGEKGTLNYVNNEWVAEPSLLYYDTPEQYERHMYCEISLETKRRWLEKRNKYKISKMQKIKGGNNITI